MRKSQLGSLSRNSYYVTFLFIRYIYFLVSSKVEFLLHKKLWILFYFDHTGYTNVDRRLMRYFIKYNWVRKRAKWSEHCVLGCYLGILLAWDFQRWSREEELSFSPYSKSFIDRACSVQIAGYWPLFFLRLYCPRIRLGSLIKYTHTRTQKTQKRAWPISRPLDLGQKRPAYMFNEYHAFTMLRDLWAQR